MKLASWNVNGLRAVMRKGELVGFLADQQPDILCLQEVKIKPEQVDFQIPDYQLILNSAERSGYAGTGLLVRNQLADQWVSDNVRYNLPDELADKYDYYYVPCFFAGDEKIAEGAPTEENVAKAFAAAYNG